MNILLVVSDQERSRVAGCRRPCRCRGASACVAEGLELHQPLDALVAVLAVAGDADHRPVRRRSTASSTTCICPSTRLARHRDPDRRLGPA